MSKPIVPPHILDSLLDGVRAGRTLTSLTEAPGYPYEYVHVLRALQDTPGYPDKYKEARKQAADSWAYRAIDAAAGSQDGVNSQSARTQLEAFKWFSSKLSPSVYGDRQAVDISGSLETRVPDVASARAALAARRAAKATES